jgi:two-component system OmpR family response regulator
MDRKTIIIVDDEVGIRQLVKTFLLRYHFDIQEAGTGKELFLLLKTTKPDLIILDLMLPDMYGLDICKEIRKTSKVPVIILTAVEGDVNTVLGFEAGADDYIEKPFSAHVLLSRIQAVLRRGNQQVEETPTTSSAASTLLLSPKVYQKAFFSQWIYIPEEACLHSNTGKFTFLTKTECQLLQLFLTHEQTILSRDQIAAALKVDIEETESRAIDVQISRLRSKLKDKSQNNLIKSIRNKGYLFSVPVRFV